MPDEAIVYLTSESDQHFLNVIAPDKTFHKFPIGMVSVARLLYESCYRVHPFVVRMEGKK